MKFLITENKLEKIVTSYMSDIFNNLKPFKSKVFPVGTFYIDDDHNIMAEVIDTKHKKGVILEYSIWCNVSDFFGFETIKKQEEYLEKWASEYFGFENPIIDFREFSETIDDL